MNCGACSHENPDGNRFEREEKTTYELGGKTGWLDGALILNGAIFFDDYDERSFSRVTG